MTMAVVDPRLVPGAYVRQRNQLYTVLAVTGPDVTLEDCLTGEHTKTYRSSITGWGSTFELVKPAPPTQAPDTVPDELLAGRRPPPISA